VNSDERTRLARAMLAYRDRRPYFYVFVRPCEHVLFARRAGLFRPPAADVGCGDGFFMGLLSDLVRVTYGVDTAPHARRNPHGAYAEVRLAHKGRIPLESARMATLLSNSVLEHVAAPTPLLGECARVLRPGGELFLTVTLRAWENALVDGRAARRPYARFMRRAQRHVTLLTANEWETLFAAAGLAVVEREGYLDAASVRAVARHHFTGCAALPGRMACGRWENALSRSVNRLLWALDRPPESLPSQGDASPCCFFRLRRVT
jgi:SAM-dependent methyltransferase